MRRRDIFFVSQYFPPEMGAPAARVFELAREWVKCGASVRVLTAFPNHPTGVIPPAYRGKVYQEERLDGVQVIRTFIYASANKGFWGRIANYCSFSLSSLITGALRLRPPDLVVATSPQFLVAVSGYLLARWWRRPFVLEIRDLWPASIVAVGAMRAGSLGVRLLERIEQYLYDHADHIVVVTESFKRVIAERGVPSGKLTVIPNGVDLDRFRPGDKPRDLLRQHGLDGRFVVGYIGTIGMAHGIGLIVDAARRFRDDPGLAFVVVGEGAERAQLEQQARAEGLTNLLFVGQVPREEIRTWTLACDACAVLLRDHALFRTVLPSKMFEIMGCGRPIILGIAGEAEELLKRAGAGIAIRPEDLEGFCQALFLLRADPDRARALGQAGHAFVSTHFRRESLARQYLHLLGRMLGDDSAQSEDRQQKWAAE